ncbi:glutaredoxin [Halomonas sp. ISL-60]|uniref:glutaredoxin family protein n=1 Tax=Halomonas sp. ISL-56 TaxID=2819149 RepID=UPI001BE4F7E2|nr:glutaredoxin [Halomonas sp. ISL-56]MBT2771334.1 glutaredoxin [Halomonas sp. ISL-60]MBT2800691.1 glutaredoxin [Halomonas sp. ISL-56]
MKAVVYSKENCGYCVRVKALLKNKGVDVEEILITDENKQQAIDALTAANDGVQVVVKQVPQVILENKFIGGYQQVCQHFGINV